MDPPLSLSTEFAFHVPHSACYQSDEDCAHDYGFPTDNILMHDNMGKGIFSNYPRPGDTSYDDNDLFSILSDLTDLDGLERLAVSHQHAGQDG